jgi:hypothetical protein
LKIKVKYVHNALNALQAALALAKLTQREKPIFVGVHCRRTDKLGQSESYSNIDGEYYRRAISMYRHDFKSPQRVIFIAATDDEDWLREAFAVKTEEFWADNVYFSADLFSSIGIKTPGAGEDLALLSLCDHSIVSVSFGSKI